MGVERLKRYGADCLTDKALLITLGKVGRNLAGTLAGLQLLGKKPLSCLKGLTFLGLLLVVHEVKIGIAFFLNGRTIKNAVDLTDEQVSGAAVEYQVMDVCQQMNAALSLHNLKAIERCFLQIERTNKLVLVGSQSLIAHLCDRNLNRYTVS